MDLKRTAAQSLTIDVVTPPGSRHARARLDGELDGTTARALTDTVARVLHTPPELIELDVAALTFVDSVGVQCLLTCRGRPVTVRRPAGGRTAGGRWTRCSRSPR